MNHQKGFIAPLLLAFIAILLIGGWVYVYVQNKQPNKDLVAVATTTPSTGGCEVTSHFSLGYVPSGWDNKISCLRGTAIFTTVSSADYITAHCDANAGGEDCSSVLVKGARFEVFSDPGYPYKDECSLPSDMLNGFPVIERRPISVDGYEGVFAHVQQKANSLRPEIDYYYVRVPISGAPCQMIDFVSVVSTNTDNGATFQEFLDNLKFNP